MKMFPLLSKFITHVTGITQNIISRHYCECDLAGCNYLISLEDLRRFLSDCFCSLGATEANSDVVAEAMVQADYRGVPGHGISNLEQYVQEIRDKTCDPKAQPAIEDEFTSVAMVKGNHGLGPVIGKFCMDIAMEKALGTGIGMVAAKESNDFGMASLYTIQAAKKGFIGLSFSNSIPRMVPPGGLDVALGTNPLSLAAPAHCEALVVDMATTAVTLPKIEQYKSKNLDLPKGWAMNKIGQTEQNPKTALAHKMLSPLGGDQKHKGFGLALLVEVLSGIISDSNYGRMIPISKETGKKQPPNLGHGFIAINPEKFVPNFATRLSKLLTNLRNMELVNPRKPILIPGDKERIHMKKVDSEGGVCYSKYQVDKLEKMSKALGVEPPDTTIPFSHMRQSKKKS